MATVCAQFSAPVYAQWVWLKHLNSVIMWGVHVLLVIQFVLKKNISVIYFQLINHLS